MPSARSIRTAALTALFALVFHAGVLAVKTWTHPSQSVLAVFRVGALMPNLPGFVAEEGYPLEQDGYGTDGQLYLFVAHDPLAHDPRYAAAIDAPRYRYGRILLPALAALTCGGSSRCLPRAILAYNLLFAAGIGWLAALLVARRGAHPVWGILLACTGALVCATDIANVELAAQFFGLLAVVLYERGELAPAIAAAAIAPLARETYVLVPMGFAAAAFLGGRRKESFAWGAAVVPAAFWGAYVRLTLPPDPGAGASVNLTYPFGGIVANVADFLRHPEPSGGTVVTVLVAVPMLIMLARHVRALPRDHSGLAIATALFGVLALFASEQVWHRPGGFARGLDFVYPGAVLGALARKDRTTLYLSLFTLLQTANILGDHLAHAG